MVNFMYSKTSTGKNPKGSVSIIVSNGRLQLRFRYAGERHYLSLGLPDGPANRKAAERKKSQIELDIISGNFDPSLAKYKSQAAFKTAAPDITPKATPTASDLWAQYREYKASSLKPTTRGYHEALARILEKIPPAPITDALKIKAELEKVTTIYQAKRILIQLSAVCKWAKKHGLLDSNPYDGMVTEMPKFNYQQDPKPNAFTEEERDRVIAAFKEQKGNWNGRGTAGIGYSHYASLVEFLFYTGCRPSEAIGMQWKNITEDCSFIRFQGSITTSGTGKPTRVKGSKNNKPRTFPCSARLRELLQTILPENSKPNDLVFPSPKGKVINYDNFCKRAWNKVVDPIKPDTTPYSCRDTFITTQILKGVQETAIADWCDTSVEMIQKNYVDHLKLLSIRPID
jgi:integrase